MLRTAIVIDRRYADHDSGPGHPESPRRIEAIAATLDSYSRNSLQRLAPRAATVDELAYAHEAAYIQRVMGTSGQESVSFDSDTRTGPKSYETARLAAGGLLTLVEAVAAGEADNGFAFVRPPGHHAERERAMGFCLFNNVAIAAEHLKRVRGFERIFIVDWDLHHGNGTQRAFYADSAVLYLSLHQYPYYPGTGAANELGENAGSGFTVNLPLPAGCGDDEYLDAFLRVLVPLSARFCPDFVLVSAGFDCHLRDPLGEMEVSDGGFAGMTRVMVDVARRHAKNRLAIVLEGGYDLEALRSAIPEVLDELSGEEPLALLPAPRPRIDACAKTLEAIRSCWQL